MRVCFFLGCWLIPLINGKYLLVEVDDNQPINLGPTGKGNPTPQCPPYPCPPRPRCAWPPCDRPGVPDELAKQDVPDYLPIPKQKSCIRQGGRCFESKPKLKKLTIELEFSFRSSNDDQRCCNGLACVLGKCLNPLLNWLMLLRWKIRYDQNKIFNEIRITILGWLEDLFFFYKIP